MDKAQFLQDYDLSYLRPPEDVYNIKHDPSYIHQVKKDNYHVRKIFYNCDYSDYENQKINELENEIKKQNIQLPSDWDRAKTLKYCLTGQMKLENSIEALKKHLEWKNNPYMHKLTKLSASFLQKGVFYVYGRDKQYRPIVIINVYQMELQQYLDEQIQAMSNLLEAVQKYMFVPSHVENFIIIIEVNDLGLSDFNSYRNSIQTLIKSLNLNFTCSLEQMFLTNPSYSIKFIWKFITMWIAEETAKKIQVIQSSEFHQIQQNISKDQIEIKYEGIAPNQSIFWPPNYGRPKGLRSSQIGIRNSIRRDSKQNLINTSIKKSKSIEVQHNLENNNLEETNYYKNYQESESYYTLENDSQEFYKNFQQTDNACCSNKCIIF